ncbi:MAG TPA: hypothetical protein PLH97_16355, partial [Verrucomicrobiota bacterium]|nr:hypothetical protein [Verrucomicrobiota bacterium]
QEARLNDRVSSAWEFLDQAELTEAHRAQIQDAIRRTEGLNLRAVLPMRWPRLARFAPLAALVFALSFFVPSIHPTAQAHVGDDPVRLAQLAQLDELKQELVAREELPKEVEEVIRKLEEMRRQFEKGEISERDVMIELARMDEALKSKMTQLGVENLESEMNAILPHLSASAATLPMAQAIKEKDFEKAAAELENLADKVEAEKLSKEEQQQLAARLGAAAAKLGRKSSDSFGGDLAKASESLEKSDHEGFSGACRNMGDKLGLMGKSQGLKSICNALALCKAGLGQCNSIEPGYHLGPKTEGKGTGGLKAGTAASGDPFGDEARRLADSYKSMLQIAGQAGAGPVESETEITEGQLSRSQLSAKEVHAAYAAVAEEVIEREDIPLSHRYHVKRYFQAIRPQE